MKWYTRVAAIVAVGLFAGCQVNGKREGVDLRPASFFAAGGHVQEQAVGPVGSVAAGRVKVAPPAALDQELWIVPIPAPCGPQSVPFWAGGLLIESSQSMERATKTSANVNVTGPVMTVQVLQEFAAADAARNATYVLPINAGATPVDIVVRMGKRRIRAIIRERAAAQKIFEAAKAQGLPAHLATAEELFSLALGNIPARQSLAVTSTYVDWVPVAENRCKFVLPVWSPEEDKLHARSPWEVPADFSLALDVNMGVKMVAYSVAAVQRVSETECQLKLESTTGLPFELAWAATSVGAPQAVLVSGPVGDGAFVLALHRPATAEGVWLVSVAGGKTCTIPTKTGASTAYLAGCYPKSGRGLSIVFQERGKDLMDVRPVLLESPYVGALVARTQCDVLAGDSSPSAARARKKLALDFGLLTPDTALLAVDTAP